MRNRIIIFILGLLMVCTHQTFASGFQINEHGARAMAMGGAFTAVANDPSTLYYNPAGITSLKGIHFLAGTTMIAPSAEFRGFAPSIDSYKMVDQVFFPSHFYATYQVNEKLYLGLGFNNPFGLGTEWDEKWPGRFVSVRTDLKTYSFTPTVGYKVLDNLSIGASLLVNFATVQIKKAQPTAPFVGEAMIDLKGNDDWRLGFTLGAKYQMLENLSLGVAYRSQVAYSFKGTASVVAATQLASKLPTGDITAKLTVPAQITGGVAWSPMNRLTVSADYQYVFWSSYDTLAIDFANGSRSSTPRLYNDSWIARLGAEYLVTPSIAVRCGAYFDKNPVDDKLLDAQLPDADRLGLSIGLGYDLTKNISLDVAYLAIRFAERTVTNSQINATPAAGFYAANGTYNSFAHLVSLSVKYAL